MNQQTLAMTKILDNEEVASKHRKEFWEKASTESKKEDSNQFVVVGRSQMHGVDFMLQYTHSSYKLSRLPLGGVDYKVLHFMQAFLDYQNFIPITQRQIAEELGLKQPNVNRSVKKLIEYEIIDKVKKGRTTYYRLSPEFGWKGSGRELQETGFGEKVKHESEAFSTKKAEVWGNAY